MITMTAGAPAQRARYNRDAILSATPVRLLTMLYDRLLLDLNRAEEAQLTENWAVASQDLLHAQAIVSELASSLNLDAWEGGEGLFALYTYVSNAMISANMHRDVDRIRESIALLEPLRQTWHEVADSLPGPLALTTEAGRELGIG